MKFKVIYLVGKDKIKEKIIEADDLTHATSVASTDKVAKNWIDIIMVDKFRGEVCY